MNPPIIYTTRPQKPQPAPDRISLGWGHSGHLHIPCSKAPESYHQQKPKREMSDRTQPIPEPRILVGQIERYSKLERIRRPKPLWEELAERSHGSRSLEYLAVRKEGDEYAIANRETGEILIGQTFETREHCYDAAVELEQTFDMGQVIERMEPETMALIEGMTEWHYLREWVALGLL
ncbi:MAG: hypothetical protein HC852_01600 [Acaryochloridaceae cyanobacterium RU_4_10]|nr:hypothetical protein [Acaryochloridaceae cyanobacterium RU_4_10]